MKLVKGLFLVLGIAGLFSVCQFDAMAACKAEAGKFCKGGGGKYPCRKGCYCEGSDKNVGSIIVDTWCNRSVASLDSTKEETLNNAGVYRCQEPFKNSDAGAKTEKDCFVERATINPVTSVTVTDARIYNEEIKCDPGYYMVNANKTPQKCPSGGNGNLFYCKGATCNYSPHVMCGIEKCPAYATSSDGIHCKLTCEPGKYLKVKEDKSMICETCLDDGYACSGGTWIVAGDGSVDSDRGLKRCGVGKVPNETHTACIIDASFVSPKPTATQQIQHTDLQVESVTSNGGSSYELPDDFQPQDYKDPPIGPVNTAVDVVTQNGTTTTDNETGETTNSEEDGDDTNENNVVNIVHVDEGMYLPAGSLNPAYCTSANAPVYSNQFCPGGDFYQNQYYDQGIYNCLNGGTANAAHTSCRVLLDTGDLMYGVSGQGECWMIENDADEYRSCVFGGAYDLSQQ